MRRIPTVLVLALGAIFLHQGISAVEENKRPAGNADAGADVIRENTPWCIPRALDTLYERIADDMKEGKPVVIATFCGQWDVSKSPEDDIHWGTRFGPWRMFERADSDAHVREQFAYWQWQNVLFRQEAEDPIRTAIFKLQVTPNDYWRKLGVEQPFKIYHVMLLFQNKKSAAIEMTTALKKSQGRRITLEDGTVLDLGKQAQILGYNGHNFYYDGPFDGLEEIEGAPSLPKGVYVIGCKTARFFKDRVIDRNIYGLLFTTSFMAPEGYNLLALTDAVAEAKSGRDLCEQANSAYQYFQVLGGQQKPGPLFINQTWGLFDEPSDQS